MSHEGTSSSAGSPDGENTPDGNEVERPDSAPDQRTHSTARMSPSETSDVETSEAGSVGGSGHESTSGLGPWGKETHVLAPTIESTVAGSGGVPRTNSHSLSASRDSELGDNSSSDEQSESASDVRAVEPPSHSPDPEAEGASQLSEPSQVESSTSPTTPGEARRPPERTQEETDQQFLELMGREFLQRPSKPQTRGPGSTDAHPSESSNTEKPRDSHKTQEPTRPPNSNHPSYRHTSRPTENGAADTRGPVDRLNPSRTSPPAGRRDDITGKDSTHNTRDAFSFDDALAKADPTPEDWQGYRPNLSDSPPLPSKVLLGALLLLGGLTFTFLVLFGVELPRIVTFLGGIAAVAGIIILILQLPRNRDDYDDGLRV